MGSAPAPALAAAAALFGVATVAAAYPPPRGEDPVSFADPVLSRGTWAFDPDGIGRGDGQGRGYLLARGETPAFTRVRVDPAGDAEIALLFRASVQSERPLRLAGYGIAINQRAERLAFLRWDPAGVRDPGISLAVPGLGAARALELVLFTSGPHFSAELFDAETRASLGHLSWSDPSYVKGALGVFADPSTPTSVRMQVSRGRDAPAAPPPWLAADWTVRAPLAVWQTLPESLRARFTTIPDAEHVVAIGDADSAGAVQSRALEGVEVHPGVGFRWRKGSSGLRDARAVVLALERLHRQYPSLTELSAIGSSASGRPLWALRIGPEDPALPSVLLSAAHHANEASSPDFVLDALQDLLSRRRDPQVRRWLAAVRIIAVPMVNPDGSEAFWELDDQLGRKNHRAMGPTESQNQGVDLNRNYPIAWGTREAPYDSREPASDFFRGLAAASEPEVRAMMSLCERERFVAAMAYHEAATRLVTPYTIPGLVDPEPALPRLIGDEIIAQLPDPIGGRRYQAVRALYPVSGTDQDWMFFRFGTLAYVLEVPYRRARGARLAQSIEHARPAWRTLLERWTQGPALSVQATYEGEPVAADIVIDELQLRAGERWQTHPRHGWWHTFLPGPGSYNVRLRYAGREEVIAFDAVAGSGPVVRQVAIGAPARGAGQ